MRKHLDHYNITPRTRPHLRKAILRRISDFGRGRIEVDSMVLESLIAESNELARLQNAATEKR